MQELRLVAVSEDGTYLVMATAGRGSRFTLPIDDRLRAAVRGNFSRLGQYEIEVESPLRPKEIQARIRAGETAEEIAEVAGIPLERVRWFEGPVLQEREFIYQQALRVSVRRPGDNTPGPALGDLVTERLGRNGVSSDELEWDAWKADDGAWRLRLAYITEGRQHTAEWTYDPRRRHVAVFDDHAARICSDEPMDAPEEPEVMATVTPFIPRLATPPAPPAPPPAEPLAPVQPSAPPSIAPSPAERTPAVPPAESTPPQPVETEAETTTAETGEAEPAHGTGEADTPVAEPSSIDPPPAASSPAERPAARRDDPAPVPAASPPSQDEQPPAPAAEEPAEKPGPQPEEPVEQPAASGDTVPPAAPARPSRSRKGRGRRASVPSWDEIMFGTRKPE